MITLSPALVSKSSCRPQPRQ